MEKISVVHISETPLAGAPIRICQALNRLDQVSARLIQLNSEGYSKLSFDKDLVWVDDQLEALDLIRTADVLHLHNYVSLESTKFEGVDFKKLWDAGKPMVRHFHSTTELVARMTYTDEQAVLACPVPKLLISQYPERFYPNSTLVPNIVFDKGPAPAQIHDDVLRISYSPSNFRSASAARWDTKGYQETKTMLQRFVKKAHKQGFKVELDIMEGVPHQECLARKAQSDVAIDDLVTGSFHLSTLESLMLGSTVLTFMDDRVAKAIRHVSGRDDFPALNVRLEDAEAVLMHLAANPQLAKSIGEQSRQWMQLYWQPETMAQHFVDIYERVIANPRLYFEPRFSLDTEADQFKNQGLYDVLWRNRHQRWPQPLPAPLLKSKMMVGNLLRALGLR